MRRLACAPAVIKLHDERHARITGLTERNPKKNKEEAKAKPIVLSNLYVTSIFRKIREFRARDKTDSEQISLGSGSSSGSNSAKSVFSDLSRGFEIGIYRSCVVRRTVDRTCILLSCHYFLFSS